MDELIPILWILLMMVVFIAIMAWNVHQAKALNDSYRSLAARLGGRAIDGGSFGRPSLSFYHGGARVMVDIYSTGGKNATYYTQVHLDWPDRAARCEVYPERFSSRLGKMLGMTDVEIGFPDFDRDFIITGSSPKKLRELLTPDVQSAIYRLRRMGQSDDIYVGIGGGKLLVKKLGLIRDEALLHDFIRAALDLYDRALSLSGEGIEIVSTREAATSESSESAEVICQICGETIVEELVYCRRCKTPHHEDCWEYFGSCSTFGCGERRHMGAKPVDPPRRMKRSR